MHPGLFSHRRKGLLYFIGRNDDIIKTRGEKVSPIEVENVLLGIKGVDEAGVIGVYDEALGQAIQAFVVRDAASELSEKEIRNTVFRIWKTSWHPETSFSWTHCRKLQMEK